MPHTTSSPQPHDADAADPMDDAPGLDSYVDAKLRAWTTAIDDSDGDPAAE